MGLFAASEFKPSSGVVGLGQVTGLPVDGPVTALFGRTDDVHRSPHSGLDIAAPEGTPVRAAAAGTVVQAHEQTPGDGWTAVFGNSVRIRHADGTYALYAHFMTKPAVKARDVVVAGQLLGLIGETGQTTGPHLHLGLAPADNEWFRKDADGGVSALLDATAEMNVSALVEPAEAPARVLAAHAMDKIADASGQLRGFIERGMPKSVLLDRWEWIRDRVAEAERLLGQV